MKMLFVPGEIMGREHCFDRIETFVKHPANPVMVPEHFWEGAGVLHPCVLYSEEEKLFKMWYYTCVGEFGKHQAVRALIDNHEIDGSYFLCYATSLDGLHWERPALGKFMVKGSTANNILLADSGFFLGAKSIVEDFDDPDPNRRYKMLIYDNDGEGRDGARTAVSPNGIDWTFIGSFPVLPSQDGPILWHDRRRGQFVASLKHRIDGRRARMVSVSKDFVTWSPPSVGLAPDLGDSPTLHFYFDSAFHHCGHDFGLLARFEQATQTIDIELTIGRQGTDWQRLPGRPIILSPGDSGAWDSSMVTPGPAEPVTRGTECWIYYGGHNVRHDEADESGGIGVASFTAGRLVGQQFEGDGWFQSLPFLCPGGRLFIDAKAKEPITVEVHGAGYLGVFKGFTWQECRQVQGDLQAHAIGWTDKTSLDELRGQFISLRVYGRNSVVYGASFV